MPMFSNLCENWKGDWKSMVLDGVPATACIRARLKPFLFLLKGGALVVEGSRPRREREGERGASRGRSLPHGCFRVYAFPTDAEHPYDIAFELTGDAPQRIPRDQRNLKSEVERSLVVISSIYRSPNIKFEYYFERLLSLSQMGLVGETANPEAATETLEALQQEFLEKEGNHAKSIYYRKVGRAAFCLGIAPLICALTVLARPDTFAKWLYGDVGPQQTLSITHFGNFVIVWAAAVLGVWLSGVLQTINVKFSRLHVLEEDQTNSWIRCLIVGASALLLGFLLYKKFVEIRIGGITITDFYEDTVTSIVLGVLCGLAGRALLIRLRKEADKALGSKKGGL
jgi:hypothetical protein